VTQHLSPLPLASRTEPLRESVFAILARRLVGYTGKRYPFHIGDNVVAPPAAAHWPAVDAGRLGSPYRYGHPSGEESFRRAIAEKLVRENGLDVGPDHVLPTVGSTHGISCVMQALMDPGDEILLLSPYWPLVRGIAVCSGVVPVDVPFYQALLDDPDADIAALIAPYVTARTKVLYVISPNNPNGVVLSPAQLDTIAAFAAAHGLWLLADEAYEHYAYARPHVSLASRPGCADRTVTAYTFSKSYAMAGARIGYVAGPERVIAAMRKVATHTVYNTAQISQAAGLAALESGRDTIELGRQTYGRHAGIVAERLAGFGHPSQGGSFAFVDLRAFGESAMPVLERAADRGVTLAPGELFGRGYAGYARLCYTATDTETLVEGLDILSEVLRAG
jgi:aspartate/methionine/tyrosine aminotransferase